MRSVELQPLNRVITGNEITAIFGLPLSLLFRCIKRTSEVCCIDTESFKWMTSFTRRSLLLSLSFLHSPRNGLRGCVCNLGESVPRQHLCFLRAFSFATRHCCWASGHLCETDSGTWSSPGACSNQLHRCLSPLWLWCTNTREWLPYAGQGMTVAGPCVLCD